uniref:Uncharacterized protein n=1 Tax=Avena sativa TaxID=4498 RepID=A0ACD5YYQ9_AVESA
MVASFGNLQIPAALLRVGMALWGLRVIPQNLFGSYEQVNTNHVYKANLLPSLNIFYVMVLGQGMLYISAGILEHFSFILRRSLVSCAGLRGLQGVQCVNLYYAYAFNKCMEGAVLAPKKTSLVTFAMDSLKSDSPKMQLYGLKMLISFLKKEPLKTRTKSKLTTSMKTVTFLVNMLGWTSEGDKVIRSLAAKVTAEIADNLRVVPVPGAMQLIASLLETVHVQKIKNPLLDIGIPEGRQGNLIEEVVHDEQTSPMLWLKQMALYCLLPREEPSNVNEQNSHILGCWKKITECWSIPEEEPSTDQDLLPVQGMLILDRLASFDLDTCTEIYKSPGLISKVIEFTSNRADMPDINEIHQTMLKTSSLKVLRRLSSTEGKFGVTLRQKISEHPFLLSHLAEILDDNASSRELRDLAIELLRNLAMDRNINEEIGSIPVIISKLMHAFFSQGAASSTEDSGQLVPGQALAVLAMDSASNCLAMLAEKGDLFIKELTDMIKGDRCRYVASCLLRDICVHARSKLRSWDLKEISSILRKVLDLIISAEGAHLEVLVGLSSQICKVIPEDFERELEHGEIKEMFIKSLVQELNSNMIPTAHCPGIRRVIVEHAIHIMEFNPSYANCFITCQMFEALLEVERKPSRAENYKFFLGDAGLMKHDVPLSALVSRAKELMKP